MTTHEPSAEAIQLCAEAVEAVHDADCEALYSDIAKAVLRCAVEKCGYPEPIDAEIWKADIANAWRRAETAEAALVTCQKRYDEIQSGIFAAAGIVRQRDEAEARADKAERELGEMTRERNRLLESADEWGYVAEPSLIWCRCCKVTTAMTGHPSTGHAPDCVLKDAAKILKAAKDQQPTENRKPWPIGLEMT